MPFWLSTATSRAKLLWPKASRVPAEPAIPETRRSGNVEMEATSVKRGWWRRWGNPPLVKHVNADGYSLETRLQLPPSPPICLVYHGGACTSRNKDGGLEFSGLRHRRLGIQFRMQRRGKQTRRVRDARRRKPALGTHDQPGGLLQPE